MFRLVSVTKHLLYYLLLHSFQDILILLYFMIKTQQPVHQIYKLSDLTASTSSMVIGNFFPNNL